ENSDRPWQNALQPNPAGDVRQLWLLLQPGAGEPASDRDRKNREDRARAWRSNRRVRNWGRDSSLLPAPATLSATPIAHLQRLSSYQRFPFPAHTARRRQGHE